MKSADFLINIILLSRSREGAWIEMRLHRFIAPSPRCRSREGAWIEMPFIQISVLPLAVAPARERGLKLKRKKNALRRKAGRSREGAWIEIL